MNDPRKIALRQSAAVIVADLADLEAQRGRIALEAFRVLERYDRETASLAMAVFDDREEAANWFVRNLPFSDVMPWELLAEGEAEKVRALLGTVSDGVHLSDG